MSVAGHLGVMRLANPLGEYTAQMPPQQAGGRDLNLQRL